MVNGWKPLTIITKSSILDVTAVLDPPLLTSHIKLEKSNEPIPRKQCYWQTGRLSDRAEFMRAFSRAALKLVLTRLINDQILSRESKPNNNFYDFQYLSNGLTTQLKTQQ